MNTALVIGLATMLAATDLTTTNVEEDPAEVLFMGRVGYKTWSGEFVPVTDASVLVGWGDGGCQFTLQEASDLVVRGDGSFSSVVYPTSRETYGALHRAGSQGAAPSCVVYTEWPCFRFRADGCNDATEPVSQGWVQHDIEMECPSRRGPRPRRDG